jgi:hypothetical protein
MNKPQLKYENGKLIAKAEVGIDGDKDGKNSVSLKAELEIDAFEAVNEIIKDGAPQWLKDLIKSKEA